MKINQLFIKFVDDIMLMKLLACYNLSGLTDMHMFSKKEIEALNTVKLLEEIREELSTYYLRCKSNIYLHDITPKKALTILKQVVRLYGYGVESHEKNINNKKFIYYRLAKDNKTSCSPTIHIVSPPSSVIVEFD